MQIYSNLYGNKMILFFFPNMKLFFYPYIQDIFFMLELNEFIPLILLNIFLIKPHFFQKYYCKVISKRIFVILGPEEAEIFKDYFFFILA